MTSDDSSRRAAWGRVVCAGAAAALAVWSMVPATAQPEAPWNGPRQVEPGWHALVNATLVPEPGRTVEDATIEIRNGSIVRVGSGAAPSAGARVWDCDGLTVYAGLIEPALKVGTPEPDPEAPGTHWNSDVMAQRSPLDGEGVGEERAKKLREMGFTVAHILPEDGVFRGTTAVVSLGHEQTQSDPLAHVIRDPVFHAVSLDSNGWGGGYPGSKMGAIALLRQVLSDAEWRQGARAGHETHPMRHERPAPDDAADALAMDLPLLFDVGDELDTLRAVRTAEEFGRDAVIFASGDEFKRLGAIVDLGAPLIVPLAYAERPAVETMAEREAADLRELMEWEVSPTNAARLNKSGATFAITSSKLPKKQSFGANLRLAIEAGLSEGDALALLTTAPAEMLGIGDRFGKVAPGMQANLVVVDGALFDDEAKIRDVWIDGERYEISEAPEVDLEGEWNAAFALESGRMAFDMTVGKGNSITLEREAIEADGQPDAGDDDAEGGAEDEGEEDAEPQTKSFKARSVKLIENRLDFVVDAKALGAREGAATVSGLVGETIAGVGSIPGGGTLTWTADRVAPDAGADLSDEGAGDDGDSKRFAGIPERFGYPFGPYAFSEIPQQPDILIVRNATVWTSGPQGIIEGGEIETRDGKLTYVGTARRSTPGGAVVIDARGKHVSPGLIDCHSHTGISGGVNEGTQATTSEVRIGDVIDPDDIGWYRQLAGGLTAANQLHGSANPIGGQNSVVKLRWGVAHPDEMRVEGAPGGIKFALGENPKRSRSSRNERYPNSRMGVESIIRDRFVAARDYAEAWAEWDKMSASARNGDVPPRRDLELEAIAEILAGERLVHCHSYRQDEILMLCRLAGEFGFTIGTFQHVLEGYKVAEAIKEHALGGSSFSDWWAYKFEVYDAIPYSGAIMHDVGVVVSFNSDSSELARRMNTEATKAVKYGGVEPTEALKFVTLNPAIQLGVEDTIGSLEEGKDADFVIWSGSPLSSLSRCERTFIDGREYFSIERDAELREVVDAERERIIQKLLAIDKPELGADEGDRRKRWRARNRPTDAGLDGATLVRDRSGRAGMFVPVGAEVDLEELRREAMMRQLEAQYDWMIRNGLEAEQMHQGDCGCGVNCLLNMRK